MLDASHWTALEGSISSPAQLKPIPELESPKVPESLPLQSQRLSSTLWISNL